MVWIHVISALIGFVSAFGIFWRRKGDKAHVLVGLIFVAALYVSALSSFLMPGTYSALHILSAMNLYWLTKGLWVLRAKPEGYRQEHAICMGACFISTIIAGCGAVTRHVVVPGATDIGNLVMVAVAFPCVWGLRRAVKRGRSESTRTNDAVDAV